MKIIKDKYTGTKVIEHKPSRHFTRSDVIIKGYLEGYYADTEPWIGISTNGRMNFNLRTWKMFKEEVENMFEEVKKERGLKCTENNIVK